MNTFTLILLLLIAGFLGWLLLLFLIPKKTVLHEILRLPTFWMGHYWPGRSLKYERIKYGPDKLQYLLYCPQQEGVEQKQEAIIYIHGGGWRYGKPEYFLTNAKFFTDMGYRVFMVSHRKVPRFKYEDLREDLNLTLEEVISFLKINKNDTGKIILGGMSSGGNLMALLLYDRNHLEAMGISQKMFKAAFFCGAPLNFNAMKDYAYLLNFSGPRNGEIFYRANPINHLQAKENTPALIIQGTHDGLVPYQAGATFVQKLQEINPEKTTFYKIEKGTHLDAASWPFKDDVVSQCIRSWFNETV